MTHGREITRGRHAPHFCFDFFHVEGQSGRMIVQVSVALVSVGSLLLVGLFFGCFLLYQTSNLCLAGLGLLVNGQGQDVRQGKVWQEKDEGKWKGKKEGGREGEDHWACWVHDAISLFEHVFFFLAKKINKQTKQ